MFYLCGLLTSFGMLGNKTNTGTGLVHPIRAIGVVERGRRAQRRYGWGQGWRANTLTSQMVGRHRIHCILSSAMRIIFPRSPVGSGGGPRKEVCSLVPWQGDRGPVNPTAGLIEKSATDTIRGRRCYPVTVKIQRLTKGTLCMSLGAQSR